MKEVFKVKKAGITSFQDMGRPGHLSWGVSHSGAMDKRLAGNANMRVGNPLDYPLLEFMHIPPVLVAKKEVQVSITAVRCQVKVNGKTSKPTFYVQVGDEIRIKLEEGVYGYLAIKGGFKTAAYLESVSFHAITKLGGGRVVNDQTLYQEEIIAESSTSTSIRLPDYSRNVIRCYRGVDAELFIDDSLSAFLEAGHLIHQDSNRMGIITVSDQELKHQHSIISSPVLPGTLQLPPGGNLIILGNDGQSIGGYPRVGKIVEEDFAIIAQKRPGEKVKFQLIDFLP